MHTHVPAGALCFQLSVVLIQPWAEQVQRGLGPDISVNQHDGVMGGKLSRAKEFWFGSAAPGHQQQSPAIGISLGWARDRTVWMQPEKQSAAERCSDLMPLISLPLRSCG